MQNPDSETMNALRTLCGNAAGKTLRAYLIAELERARDMALEVDCTGETRGEGRALRTLLNAWDKAEGSPSPFETGPNRTTPNDSPPDRQYPRRGR